MQQSNKMTSLFALITFLTVSVIASASGQDPTQPPVGFPGGGGGAGGGFGGRQRAASAGPRPYADVITAKAKTEDGLFKVHRIDDRILFEIPTDKLERVMLFSYEIAQLSGGNGYGGTAVSDKVIRWTRRGNKVYLRLVDVSIRAEGDTPIHAGVAAASLEPIVLAFDVEAENKDKSPVIDVTRLFNTDIGEFAVKNRLGGSAVDATRTYVENIKAFPTNIETKTLYTFQGGGGGLGAGAFPLPQNPTPTPGPRRAPRNFPRAGGGSTITALIHYSMVLLPEKPMTGRYRDSRVGFFSDSFSDYGSDEHRVVDRRYINRYRLEKKDPKAALSEPVKPMVYYLSREIPDKWRPYMMKGVESWNEAFEQAGFKNAIVCKNAPSMKEDPDWDPEDARYSVIRWAPTPTENAQGPHVSDPRSGEIISAHIIVWHNVMKLGETWYFTQVGPLDKRAAKLPLPDDLMGEILQYIVCHEVGHTLGLEHNFKGSSAYTVAQLRDKAFTEKYGDEASIMDYGRFNYVAQPYDNARLIPILGPYDKFAISWGYTPIPSAKNPEDEKRTLDDWASKQVTNPMLRFGNNAGADPSVQTEDLGSDGIEATRMGLKNISRVAQMLIPATVKTGEPYDLLDEMYLAMMAQRSRELGHVANIVGGVVETDYHAGHGSDVFKFVSKDQQARAVKFLLENGFTTPTDLIMPAILNRIDPVGVSDQILGSQRGLLATLLAESRVKRMLDAQALMQTQTYTAGQLITDLQNGIWSELAQPKPVVDLYRRNLQRAYLEQCRTILVGDSASVSELRPLTRGALRDLIKQVDVAAKNTKDRDTMIHLQDTRTQIERILNPKT